MAKAPASTKDLLKQHLKSLQGRRADLEAANAPLQVQLNDINAQIEALRAQAKDLARQIKGVGKTDGIDAASLDQEIAQVAIALGSARMSETPAA